MGKFETGSFDAVIITLVLCSVTGVQDTLREIRHGDILNPFLSLLLTFFVLFTKCSEKFTLAHDKFRITIKF